MNKMDKFIDWVCGKSDDFPFFKDEIEVEPPFNWERIDHDTKECEDDK